MERTFLEQNKLPLLFGHRGASSIAPENTLASFSKAVQLGCPGIELDVHLTKDEQLVVIHDSSLKRTARIKQDSCFIETENLIVENLTLEELSTYDIGVWFAPEFEGEKIQTLDQILEFLPQTMYVDIELKSSSIYCKPLAKKTAEVLSSRSSKNFIVSSFNPISLFFFKKYSSLPTALIYAFNKEVPFYLRRGQGRFLCNPDILKPTWFDYKVPFEKKTDEKTLQKKLSSIKKLGRPALFWTVDDPNIAQLLLNKGAYGIITNKPQLMTDLPFYS